ncbi:MAG: hypothetical protein EXS08_09695 [Planctomycetes bacterium]|nr:hypothetical protein [Planctomycetota bacterium]
MADPGLAGFPYDIQMKEHDTGSIVWKAAVWAVGRTALTGIGVHQIELVVSAERLFVFGIESNGAYAEAFAVDDGRPLLRFCTCYWFNFSETWSLR